MKINRYNKIPFYLKELILFVILLFGLSCETEQEKVEGFERLRVEKLSKSRPLIHNNDGDDHLFSLKSSSEFSIQSFLDIRSSGLAGIGISTLSYCTSRSFSLFTHKTGVGETYTKDFYLPERKNIVSELMKVGTDPLEVTINFAHEQGFEFFWSNRMNDTHDAAHRPDKPHAQWNSFKEEHPEFLFGGIGERLPHGQWSAVDFSHKEIRDLCVQFFTEVCENYDVDGVELDFFRHLYLFKNVAKGEVASEEQAGMITDMVTRIREMTKRVGMKKGKPILVLTRVPDSFEYCRSVGIDLEEWMEKDLIDIVVGGGYFRLNPWNYLVEQGQKYGVKIYADFSESRIKDGQHPLLIRNQDAVYRARAAAAWEAGADGIYSFNEFNMRRQYLREIGKPEELKNTSNLYFVTYRNGNPNAYLKEGKKYLTLPVLSPVNPIPIESEPLNFMIEIGDEKNRAKVYLILFGREINPEDLEVLVNNVKVLIKKSTPDGLFVYEVSDNTLQPGINHLSLRNLNGNVKSGSNPSLLDAAILFSRDSNDPALKELTEIC